MSLTEFCCLFSEKIISTFRLDLDEDSPFNATFYEVFNLRSPDGRLIVFKNGNIKSALVHIELRVYQKEKEYFAQLSYIAADSHFQCNFRTLKIGELLGEFDDLDLSEVQEELKSAHVQANLAMNTYLKGLELLQNEPKLDKLFDQLRDWGFSAKRTLVNCKTKEHAGNVAHKFVISDYFSPTIFEAGVTYFLDAKNLDAPATAGVQAYLKNGETGEVLETAQINVDAFAKEAVVFPWLRMKFKAFCQDAMIA